MFRVWCREVSANGEDKPLRAKSEDEENLLIFRKAPERVAWFELHLKRREQVVLAIFALLLAYLVPTVCSRCEKAWHHEHISASEMSHTQIYDDRRQIDAKWLARRHFMSFASPLLDNVRRTLWGHPNHPRQRKAWQDSMEAMAAMACSRCLLADPVIGCQCDRGGHPSHIYLDLARRRRKSTCWGKIQKHLRLLAQPALDMERAKTMFRCIYIFVYCAHIYN